MLWGRWKGTAVGPCSFVLSDASPCSVPVQGSLASGTSPSSARWRSWPATAPSPATTSSAANRAARRAPRPRACPPPPAPAPLPAPLRRCPCVPPALRRGHPRGTPPWLLRVLGGGQAGGRQPGNPPGTTVLSLPSLSFSPRLLLSLPHSQQWFSWVVLPAHPKIPRKTTFSPRASPILPAVACLFFDSATEKR